MLKNNLRRYSSGFTLVETMVSVAIMTLVVLGVLQILGMQLKVSNTARIDSDVSNTVFLVNAVLKNSNACKENIPNFGNKKVTLPVAATEKLAVPSLDYPLGGGKLVSVGAVSSSKAAILKDMNLSNFKLLSNTGGYNIISSELIMQFEKPQAVGAQVTNRKVTVQLRTDASGLILDCSGEGTELTDFQLKSMCDTVGIPYDVATKKCTIPPPPPPQTIVMQMPVPVPVPVAMASAPAGNGPMPASAPGFASGPNVASNSTPPAVSAPPQPAYVPPPAYTPQPAVIAAVAPPAPQPAPYVPPPQPVYVAPVQQGPTLFSVTNPNCTNYGLITTESSCQTRQVGFDGQGNSRFLFCGGQAGFSYDNPDVCPNTRM